jgi:hypothetical protein
MESVLGPDGPARDQQGRLFAGEGVGMDDPEVDAPHLGRIGPCSLFIGGDRHLGRHVDEQLGAYVQQSDRAHRAWGVGDGPRKAQGQGGHPRAVAKVSRMSSRAKVPE